MSKHIQRNISRIGTFLSLVVLPLSLFVIFLIMTATLRYEAALRIDVMRSQEARAAAQQLLTLLVDSETGARGYLATGERLFLEPHRAAVQALPGVRAKLADRMTPRATSAATLAELDRLIAHKLDLTEASILEARDSQRREALLAREQMGKQAMDRVRLLIGRVEGDEAAELAVRLAAADRVNVWIGVLTGVVFVALALMIAILARVMRRELKARQHGLVEASARSDAAEQANEAKSRFLAIMSHEIRTPLNGVLGMAQAMDADDLSAVQRDRLDVIRQSGESLLAILNDVLDLSKIEAGRLDLEAADFSMHDLARGAHAAFTTLANKKGLSFDLVVEPRAQGVYRGDSTRVRQILYNLISNALKFTDRGEVRVIVSESKEGVILKVSDTGVGIAPDRLPQLFQSFEQADVSTTRKYGGTGLGLAICRELAHLMEGTIRAESRPGKGTTFTVVLPLPKGALASALASSQPSAAAMANFPLGARLRVLAAEDNTVNQLVLKTLLHQVGAEPMVVGDGAQALAAWREQTWDVILMDIQMPVMDGRAATDAIRRLERETGRARTPIIALTANAMAHQVAEYLAADMDGVVSKPIDVHKLFQTLDEVLPASVG